MEKTIHAREYAVLLRLLRAHRIESGITQVQLAEQLNMTQSAFSKLERGELRLDLIQLRAICQLLGIQLVDFVTSLEQALKRPARQKTFGKSGNK